MKSPLHAPDTDTQRLTDAILAFIARGADQPPDDARFNALALEVFAYQFERNASYRAYCRARGATPATVRHWTGVPAVPTAAFKELPIACFPVERAVAVYRSSGTTGQKRSQHYLPTLELYEASLKPNFLAHVLPEGNPVPMLILAPPPRLMPHSSLVHMLEVVRRAWGAPGSDYFINESGLQHDRLVAALRDAGRAGSPVCLLGTAFAFVHLLDYCQERGLRFRLPPGSRIMDTGGYKGRSREVPKEDLHRLYEAVLGIPPDHVVNEYGMTEMGTQFYDNVLRDPAQEVKRPRFKVVPPWARTVVVDPETLAPLVVIPSPPQADEEPIVQWVGTTADFHGSTTRPHTGLLRHYDLANLHSATALQTDDVGVAVGDGFEILGRASGTEARGCSMAIDELLNATSREQP